MGGGKKNPPPNEKCRPLEPPACPGDAWADAAKPQRQAVFPSSANRNFVETYAGSTKHEPGMEKPI